MADNPNVGPEPVDAKPNHVREKTFTPPNPPAIVQEEEKRLPDGATRDKVSDDMKEAVTKVKQRL